MKKCSFCYDNINKHAHKSVVKYRRVNGKKKAFYYCSVACSVDDSTNRCSIGNKIRVNNSNTNNTRSNIKYYRIAKSIKKLLRLNELNYFNQHLSIALLECMFDNFTVEKNDDLFFNFKYINDFFGNSIFYDRFKNNKEYVKNNNINMLVFSDDINRIFLQHFIK